MVGNTHSDTLSQRPPFDILVKTAFVLSDTLLQLLFSLRNDFIRTRPELGVGEETWSHVAAADTSFSSSRLCKSHECEAALCVCVCVWACPVVYR